MRLANRLFVVALLTTSEMSCSSMISTRGRPRGELPAVKNDRKADKNTPERDDPAQMPGPVLGGATPDPTALELYSQCTGLSADEIGPTQSLVLSDVQDVCASLRTVGFLNGTSAVGEAQEI